MELLQELLALVDLKHQEEHRLQRINSQALIFRVGPQPQTQLASVEEVDSSAVVEA